MSNFISILDQKIKEKKKMTNNLYKIILEGKATKRLLQNFIIHRYPVKDLWTRHLMSIASRIDDYDTRRLFLENAFEEETGGITQSRRHVESFVNVGIACGLTREEAMAGSVLPETKALCEFNWNACNNTAISFTNGVAAVIYLMEGQPPIINSQGESMESVIKNVYGLPPSGYEFFTHHASSENEEEGVSELEDEHAAACKNVLIKYCNTPELQKEAISYLEKAIQLRHDHFDAIYKNYYNDKEEVFRYNEQQVTA